MELNLLVAELANFLQVGKFQDYCPNGLHQMCEQPIVFSMVDDSLCIARRSFIEGISA